jgi:hypothetical protein
VGGVPFSVAVHVNRQISCAHYLAVDRSGYQHFEFKFPAFHMVEVELFTFWPAFTQKLEL